MFELEKAISAWRRSLECNRAFRRDDLDELEQHVRDQVVGLVRYGVPEEEAFARAMAEMGDYGSTESEYRKVYWGKVQRQHQLTDEITWRLFMFKNYLKTALRNLLRQKGYSFLNVAGLTLGMACCLLLFQYVAYETSYDDFNTKKDRIYRSTFQETRNGEDQGFGGTQGYIYGPTMAAEVPGIARYARVHPNYGDAVISYQSPSGDRTFKEPNVFFVDSTFLRIFDYPLVDGDRATALREPLQLLLTEAAARKYFGPENPIGKSLEFTGWIDATYTVAGVLKDVPSTSHMQFDFLLPIEDLLEDGRFEQGGSPWGWQNFVTYFELEPNADPGTVEARITELYARYRADGFASQNITAKAYLQPLSDIHLNREIQAPAAVTGDRKTVYFFTIVGLVTLVIALVNYVNLATARALDRAREVGVRKVVGAHQMQLIWQFLMESALMNLIALVLAIVLSLALLPVVNQVAETKMTMDLWLDGRFWAVFLGIFGVGALLSGLYPAFILSSFKPASVLKGKVGAFASRVALRKVLVVVQFAASIALLAGTAIVYTQLNFMRSLDTGFDLQQVLVVEGPSVRTEGTDPQSEMKTFKTELQKIPGVGITALSGTTPGRGFFFYTNLWRSTADPSTAQDVRGTSIDHDFAEVYGLELVAGEDFYEGMAVPDSGAQPIMINESMVRAMGFASNEEAVNQNVQNSPPGLVIRGVYKDFQWSSAHQGREAVVFLYRPGSGNISMKVNVADAAQTISAIEKTYTALFPGNPFNYYFADAAFDEQYRADQRFATLFAGFAGIAIIIACLGLFGLASFTAVQRTKEIGVRKVLGASVPSIVGLLSKDFLILVGVAFVVAVPAAYFYMKSWLENFEYHIELGPGVFLIAGALSLVIALATVSYQAVKAAVADPVSSLRYE